MARCDVSGSASRVSEKCLFYFRFLNLTSESLIDPLSIYFYAINRTNCISS